MHTNADYQIVQHALAIKIFFFFQIALDQILFKSCALLQSFAFDAIQSGGVKPQNHRLCKMLTKFKNNRNRRFLLKTIYIIDLS